MTNDYPYKVRFKWRYGEMLKDLSAWCNENCTGEYQYQYTASVFWFKESKDAMMFKLANNL